MCTVSVIAQYGRQLESFPETATLEEAILAIESESDLHFFFRPEWIDSIRIQSSGPDLRLERFLDINLEGTGLKYTIVDEDVFIYPGRRINASLPEYALPAAGNQMALVRQETGTSGQYIETKRISSQDMITVGSRRQLVPGKYCKVFGSIYNVLTNEPLIGATVIVEQSGTGTVTNAEGEFVLNLREGEYTIRVNHIAMKEVMYNINVLSTGSIDIELENEIIEIEEVTISDKRHDNVEGMLMGFDRITTNKMKEIPIVLGEKDILKVAQMLPGVENAGEGSSGFNVRGGSADQNMFYINNIAVYNTSHLFGFFTSFSPDIISDFSLYKNNIPPKYGGRIASIFEINTRQGNKQRFFAQGGISPVTGHASIEGPLIKKKVSYVASFRSTYSDWLLKRVKNPDIRNSDASFYDGTLALDAKINDKNHIKLFYYRSSDRFTLSSKNEYSYANTGFSGVWNHRISDAFSVEVSASRSGYGFKNIDKTSSSEPYSQKYSIDHTETRADFSYAGFPRHRIEFGFGNIYYDLDRGDILPYGESSRIPVFLGTEQGIENSVHISDEFHLMPRLNVLLGMRYSFYSMLGPSEVNIYGENGPRTIQNITDSRSFGTGTFVKWHHAPEPRMALNYRVSGNSSVKASYNRLCQYAFLLSNTIAISPNDQWKLADYYIAPPRADQVSAGYYQDLFDDRISLSVELYRKWIENNVEYLDGADFISGDPVETQLLQGLQNSSGIEFMVKSNMEKLSGWIAYTLSRSMVEVESSFEGVSVNNGLPFPSNYDRPHSLNVVANYRISKRISFSSNMVYSTGRPVTLPVSTYYSEGKRYLLYSTRNKYRLPDYFRIDFSFNLEGNLRYRKLAHSFWMLNVYNLTGRDNVYSVFYRAEDGNKIQGYKLSVFAQPIVTLSWNFKFGNYNSK